MRMSQTQMYWAAHRKSADVNITFMEMVQSDNPLTKAELEKLIEKRPELWGRFSNWLKVLT